jgi:hypothetical protein
VFHYCRGNRCELTSYLGPVPNPGVVQLSAEIGPIGKAGKRKPEKLSTFRCSQREQTAASSSRSKGELISRAGLDH